MFFSYVIFQFFLISQICSTESSYIPFSFHSNSNNDWIQEQLDIYNEELRQFNHLKANIAWNITMNYNSSDNYYDFNKEISIGKNLWNNNFCNRLKKFKSVNWRQLRQIDLICRGPRFTAYQLRNIIDTLTEMAKIYALTEICLNESDKNSCMRMEPGLNKLMENNRDEKTLRKAWISWHEIGTKVKPLYIHLIKILNAGARFAGYEDMGEIWREETEITNLKELALKLQSEVDYLYKLLHSYVRFQISKFYSIEITGAIPSHLLGNMYSQKWDSLIDIIFPSDEDQKNILIKEKLPSNATVLDMVKYAENFYRSMGFPPLPPKFYENSKFTETDKSQNCHGSSANFFDGDDYRIVMCAEVRDEDLLTIMHEMGHIYYFYAYTKLPTIFQDGAMSAFHEAVGDSTSYSFQKRDEIRNLLKTALAKLPQIQYGLVTDLWRWNLFEDKEMQLNWNKLWWELNHKYLGIQPPIGYETKGFDALGKFHILENIPYIRYFLASFLQIQFYEGICGNKFCNLEGNKFAGEKLWNMMSKGSSEHWSFTLNEMIGTSQIKSDSIIRYFKPLQNWLESQIKLNNLTIGW